ncbi:hypothetical protein LVJ82_10300 [Vitreoscilla massiliensis]|uniref:DUF2878 domain-containing protein n=1 Tax=Vitreoscilla massiliensis TaxID=1689272 RepID=A0ABY4E3A1_9NEIS|nr:Na+:solute symporter [Vitreoscilla massiliensis]UOO87882.1 hypothetical protein LVJ82_10300 [Vitreoscilla massiliensis]
MVLSYAKTWWISFCGLCTVVALQAFSSFQCYQHDVMNFLLTLGVFVLVPLIPSLIAMMTRNPLCALGGYIGFVPWLGYAYYVDCVRLQSDGGGASMVYVSVLLYGSLSCLLGVLLWAAVMWVFQIKVLKRKEREL